MSKSSFLVLHPNQLFFLYIFYYFFLSVLISIIILVFRSCYTVYWEERQKKKKEKKLKEDIEMMQNVGKSNDNVFKVNTLEKSAKDRVMYVSEKVIRSINFNIFRNNNESDRLLE